MSSRLLCFSPSRCVHTEKKISLHYSDCGSSFSFLSQLIASPDQLGTGVFRSNIKKAIETLEQSKTKGLPLADKALGLLTALEPLYSPEFLAQPLREREKKKSTVMAEVKRLAFPYHDPLPHQGLHGSPASRPSASSPQSFSQSPPMSMGMVSASMQQATTPTSLTHPQQHQHHQQPSHHQHQQHQELSSSSVYSLPPMSSMRTSNGATSNGSSNGSLAAMTSYTSPTSTSNPMVSQAPGQPQTHTPPITNMLTNGAGTGYYSPQQETTAGGYGGMHHTQSMYVDGSGANGTGGSSGGGYRSYVHPMDEGMVFGAAAGIGQGEWTWFTREYVSNGR
jgi:hypothetical protein